MGSCQRQGHWFGKYCHRSGPRLDDFVVGGGPLPKDATPMSLTEVAPPAVGTKGLPFSLSCWKSRRRLFPTGDSGRVFFFHLQYESSWLPLFLTPCMWPVCLSCSLFLPWVSAGAKSHWLYMNLVSHHRLSTAAPHGWPLSADAGHTEMEFIMCTWTLRMLTIPWRCPLGDLTQFLSVITQ